MPRTYATLGADGIVTLAQRPTVAAPWTPARGESFTGNAVLTQFTLAHTPLYGVSVTVAGVRIGATVVGTTMTLTVAPALNAVVLVDYEY